MRSRSRRNGALMVCKWAITPQLMGHSLRKAAKPECISAAAERAQARKSQVGSGDRSERIRTYNFPQGRVTDHRINLTLHKLERILDGEGLDEMVDALVTEDQAARLAEDETVDA